jgi:hypothetical protein
VQEGLSRKESSVLDDTAPGSFFSLFGQFQRDLI